MTKITSDGTTAADILKAAAGHMKDRAATYDKPEGERSIGAAVRAFNAVTGDGLMDSEERGWLFMVLLKAVRSQQGDYRADSYEDGAAYFALTGEAAARDRQPTPTKNGYQQVILHGHELDTDFDSEHRMPQIGTNGNDGQHYDHDGFRENTGYPGDHLMDCKIQLYYEDGTNSAPIDFRSVPRSRWDRKYGIVGRMHVTHWRVVGPGESLG